MFIQEKGAGGPVAGFEPTTMTIHFNPCMGARWASGAVASPAVILAHELGHAREFARDPAEYRAGLATREPGFPNGEEKRNFLAVEAPVTKELGEPMRDGPSTPAPLPCSTAGHR